jgi:hypothetical protein
MISLSKHCSCDRAHVGGNIPTPGETVDIGPDPADHSSQSATVIDCARCGKRWLRYRLKDWVARSDRWYRVEVESVPEIDQVRALIEAADYCYAGGDYHRPGADGRKLRLADGTVRRPDGFRWNRPINVR